MSYSLEELRELGTQKIHNDTHIIKSHIDSILNEDFESINKVQMFGFLSIIEKEYDLDLTHIRENAKEFYKEQEADSQEHGGVFVIASKNKKSSIFYIILIFIVFITVAFLSLEATSKNNSVESENRVIEEVKKNINLVKSEKKSEKIEQIKKITPIVPIKPVAKQIVVKKEKAVVVKPKIELPKKEKKVVLEKKKEIVVKKESKPQEVIVPKSLSLIPNTKVWVGYINITKNKKYQKILSEEFSFNPKEEWLMILGHSNVRFNLNGKDIFYKNRKSLRLHYKAGLLQEVTLEEFRKINRGKKW